MTEISHNGSRVSSPHRAPARAVTGLRRFAALSAPSRAVAREEAERCALCGEVLGARHAHLAEVRERSLVCACTACALLFTRAGAAGGRYRTVPDRVVSDPAGPLTDAEWAELGIPVDIVFFFRNSERDQVVASYPSPAGVTECDLDLTAWDELATARPLLRAIEPDVEAILVAGSRPRETFLVPIDACYSLAGALRLNWHGFDGGAEVRQILATFLDGLRQRARPLEAGR
jgi:hypothetical protein